MGILAIVAFAIVILVTVFNFARSCFDTCPHCHCKGTLQGTGFPFPTVWHCSHCKKIV